MQINWKVSCTQSYEKLNQNRIRDNQIAKGNLIIQETERKLPKSHANHFKRKWGDQHVYSLLARHTLP